MRQLLVCVGHPALARRVVATASRLAATGTVRVVGSEAEVIARLAERPATLILVDGAAVDDDRSRFMRGVLLRSPASVVLVLDAGHRRGRRHVDDLFVAIARLLMPTDPR